MIMVTGANGQVGSMLRNIIGKSDQYIFIRKSEMDISDLDSVQQAIDMYAPQVIINCAAYTAVDRAEEESDQAYLVNATGVKNLVESVKNRNVLIIHISTDYVYNNDSMNRGLVESDTCTPQGVYAQSKYKGEKYLREAGENYVILRTSWVYSEFGKNFMKTMLTLSEKHKTLQVVDDQVGSPTYARDLAAAAIKIANNWLESGRPEWKKVYNFSNDGAVSWLEFARMIFDINQIYRIVKPISTEEFGAAAPRPRWSVLDTSAISMEQGIPIRNWITQLKNALLHYENNREDKN